MISVCINDFSLFAFLFLILVERRPFENVLFDCFLCELIQNEDYTAV